MHRICLVFVAVIDGTDEEGQMLILLCVSGNKHYTRTRVINYFTHYIGISKGATPPPTAQIFFQFHTLFWKIWQNPNFSTGGWAPPLTGNLGSAPALCGLAISGRPINFWTRVREVNFALKSRCAPWVF